MGPQYAGRGGGCQGDRRVASDSECGGRRRARRPGGRSCLRRRGRPRSPPGGNKIRVRPLFRYSSENGRRPSITTGSCKTSGTVSIFARRRPRRDSLSSLQHGIHSPKMTPLFILGRAMAHNLEPCHTNTKTSLRDLVAHKGHASLKCGN